MAYSDIDRSVNVQRAFYRYNSIEDYVKILDPDAAWGYPDGENKTKDLVWERWGLRDNRVTCHTEVKYIAAENRFEIRLEDREGNCAFRPIIMANSYSWFVYLAIQLYWFGETTDTTKILKTDCKNTFIQYDVYYLNEKCPDANLHVKASAQDFGFRDEFKRVPALLKRCDTGGFRTVAVGLPYDRQIDDDYRNSVQYDIEQNCLYSMSYANDRANYACAYSNDQLELYKSSAYCETEERNHEVDQKLQDLSSAVTTANMNAQRQRHNMTRLSDEVYSLKSLINSFKRLPLWKKIKKLFFERPIE